jgi:hypothetical protein
MQSRSQDRSWIGFPLWRCFVVKPTLPISCDTIRSLVHLVSLLAFKKQHAWLPCQEARTVTAEVRFPPAESASFHFCPYGTCPNMSHGRPKWRLAMAALRRSALAQIVHRSNFYQLTNLQLDPPEVEAYYSSSQYIDDHYYNCTRLQN